MLESSFNQLREDFQLQMEKFEENPETTLAPPPNVGQNIAPISFWGTTP